MERNRVLRLRLLESAARIALSIAILGCTVAGDPGPALRAAMHSQAGSNGSAGCLPTAVEPTPDGEATREGETPELPVDPLPTAEPADHPPTWIEAQSVGLYAPVIEVGWHLGYLGDAEVIEWDVPDNEAGFHSGSAYPGQPGNTVISGHHNIGGEVFRRLIDLQIGDQVTLYVDKTPHHYHVVLKQIVREFGVSEEQRRENAGWIAPTDDERLTLITCWPYSGNSHRLIVVALPER